jgi:hypothetical protein
MQHSESEGSAAGRESRGKLARTLKSVFSEAVYDQSGLRDDVCAYVRDLKKSGESAQSIVVAARNLVRETSLDYPVSDRTEKLLTTLLGWCLDEYYRESA